MYSYVGGFLFINDCSNELLFEEDHWINPLADTMTYC